MEIKSIKKAVRWIIALIVVFVAGFLIGCYTYFNVSTGGFENLFATMKIDKTIIGEDYEITVSNIEEVLKPASDLVVTKYFYKDASTYENHKELFGKKLPFTTDKVVFTYEGTIGIGIELSEVNYAINDKSKVIIIKLPEVKILSNEIDHSSFEYPYISDSVFNDTVMGDYTSLIAQLKQEKADAVINNTELIESTRENVKVVLKNFLTSSDMTKDYTVEFR